jgi:outer membrane protein
VTLNLEIRDIEALRESHATLPNVELFFQMRMEGWGRSMSNAWDELQNHAKPDYAVGVQVSRSATNRAARARAAMANLERNRQQMSLLELEQAILLDLDSAAAQIQSNWKRLGSARKSRELAAESLQAEQKRYETGISSTFILISLQNDLANAQIRELIAANDYRKSVVEWERQTSTILQKHHIEL